MKSVVFSISGDGFGGMKLGKLRKTMKSQIYGDLLNILYLRAVDSLAVDGWCSPAERRMKSVVFSISGDGFGGMKLGKLRKTMKSQI